jgi:CheY-like chemotaxis protein
MTTTSAQPIPPPFDVLILDYEMPRMDGFQTAKEILKIILIRE